MKTKWFQAAHRIETEKSTHYYCCQDHFDVKNDMENYTRFQIYGGARTLKAGVIPHKFQCQPNRLLFSNDLNRSAFKKLNRKRDIREMLNESKSSIKENTSPANRKQMRLDSSFNDQEASSISLNDMLNEENNPSTSSHSTCTSTAVPVRAFGEGSYLLEQLQSSKTMISCGVQVRKSDFRPHFRSKQVMCRPEVIDFSCNIKPYTTDAACSPISLSVKSSSANSKPSDHSSSIKSKDKNSSDCYVPSSKGTSSTSSLGEKEINNQVQNQSALNLTRYFIMKCPKEYIGILPDCLWILDILKCACKTSEENILLTLSKIRMNDTYSRLGNEFGVSTSQASRKFNKTVKLLSHFIQTLVFCPSVDQVKQSLPIPFRAYYCNVYVLIDAFEIEIQKPSDTVHQALTWSEYKKCNTIKYLVACTPDGLITFISKGYGGRVSDVILFEKCGIMDVLPAKCSIMADRGFKHLDNVLHTKGCTLIRPPSVFESIKPTKEEVLETKRIASLRIHVERVIRRIREYKILKPHSNLDLMYMPIIDDIVKIVCGLIDLQSPIIKL